MLYAVMMVKDEADVIEHNIHNLFMEGVDGIIVADNLSTDATPRILAELQSRYPKLTVVKDNEPAYWQSQKTTDLGHRAHAEFGADWIMPVDADELWLSTYRNIGHVIRQMPDWIEVVHVPIYNHFATERDDESDNPFERMCWQHKDIAPLHKVCYRYFQDVTVLMGNHGVVDSEWNVIPGYPSPIYLRHYPYRSFSQFVSKVRNGAAAYKLTDYPENIGEHWRRYGEVLETQGEAGLRAIWDAHFYYHEFDDLVRIYRGE